MWYNYRMRVDPRKRQFEKEKEFLEETGGDNEQQARKVVAQHFKEAELAQLGKRTYFLERLDSRRKYNDYNQLCAQITLFYIEEEQLPRTVRYKIQYDTKGVLLFVNVGKRVYQRAFRSVREPLYDLNACMVFATSIGSLLNHNGRTSKSQQA